MPRTTLAYALMTSAALAFAPSPLLLVARRGGAAARPLLHARRTLCAMKAASEEGGQAGGLSPSRSFESVGLRPELLASLKRLGFDSMSDIQQRALPAALAGRDVVGKGKTGSGKTAAFGLPLLHQLDLDLDHRGGRPQALVLSPTRELSEQLVTSLRTLATSMQGVRVLAVTGGQPSRDQRARLEAGAHVVVATPGRCLQLLEGGHLDPEALKTLVLDEADR